MALHFLLFLHNLADRKTNNQHFSHISASALSFSEEI